MLKNLKPELCNLICIGSEEHLLHYGGYSSRRKKGDSRSRKGVGNEK